MLFWGGSSSDLTSSSEDYYGFDDEERNDWDGMHFSGSQYRSFEPAVIFTFDFTRSHLVAPNFNSITFGPSR